MDPSLEAVLRRIIPGAAATSLLRACLLQDERGGRAWDELAASGIDLVAILRADTLGLRRLAPLLHVSLVANGARVDPFLATVLRTAHVRESLRSEEYGLIVADVLGALKREGLEPVAFGAAALGTTAYGDATLRHGHDIDLLLSPSQQTVAVRVLEAHGYQRLDPIVRPGSVVLCVQHPSGVPILLHARLFLLSWYGPEPELIFSTGIARANLSGCEANVLTRELHALRALGRASFSESRASLQWVVDAWTLMSSPRFDQDLLENWIGEARLGLPATVQLAYLARELGVAIPENMIDRIRGSASGSRPEARDVALYGVRQGAADTLSGSDARLRLVDRIKYLRWTLIPTIAYVRWTAGSGSGPRILMRYLARPLRHLRTRLALQLMRLKRRIAVRTDGDSSAQDHSRQSAG